MEKETLDQTEKLMNKAITKLKEDLSLIRTGRVNSRILEKISIIYYETPTPITQLCQVSIPDARTLLLQPWDKNILKEVEKAILKSDLGITPSNDGTNIRLVFPPLSEDRRKELVKNMHKHGEECKVIIRNIRRDQNEHIKRAQNDDLISEDLMYNIQEKIQKTTDKFILMVEELVRAKEKEIMEVH
ncbi:MAG: Ribosome-recycling factor [candidate division WS2 bacterium]|nr:Ribosome-recycling factor [Candidatus Lithacetigena glycinireducens]